MSYADRCADKRRIKSPIKGDNLHKPRREVKMEIIVKEKIVPNEKNEADTANPENAIFSGKEVSP